MNFLLGVRRCARIAACAGGALTVTALDVQRGVAQGTTVVMGGRPADWSDAAVASEEENYLRVLQVAGLAKSRPWSLRPFGPGEVRDLLPAGTKHPWSRRFAADSVPSGAFRVRSVGFDAGLAVNTGFPLSMNDGAIWTGRGPTVYARGGYVLEWRAVRGITFSARIEPTAFWASNLSASIAPNGQTGPRRFGDALEPFYIDNPQRFGSTAYARLDPGQSDVRLDVFVLTAGISTANAWWGPTITDPQILGSNAAGFPHAFIGTSHPVNLGFGTIHAQLIAGKLSQSAYSPMPADSADRTATGGVVVFSPAGAAGLELGATRFIHTPWSGTSHALSRITAGIASGVHASDQTNSQNQLASVFGRWVFAPARFEVWGEYMRNDAVANSRDLAVEPDHDVGFTVGARRVWTRADGGLGALRVEWLNDAITHLDRVRDQVRPYQHTQLRQGHTELGQVLGSEGGQGGSSVTLGYDRYARDGRWTFEAARRVVQSSLVEAAPVSSYDVLLWLRAERLRFGKRHDLFYGAAVAPELNRNFGSDAFNLRLDAGYRF